MRSATWMAMWMGMLGACAGGETTDTTEGTTVPEAQTFRVSNSGNADREGHTPRGFQGQGGGLFVGDNLNAGFPEGDGVQIFLSFNIARSLDDVLQQGAWTIDAATVAADVTPEIEGTPFADLGNLLAEEVVFDDFSSALWNLDAPDDGATCVFSTGPGGEFSCDLAGAVERALEEERRFVNVRLAFETAGDSDGEQDMVFFFIDDVNATEPGIFSLSIDATPEG